MRSKKLPHRSSRLLLLQPQSLKCNASTSLKWKTSWLTLRARSAWCHSLMKTTKRDPSTASPPAKTFTTLNAWLNTLELKSRWANYPSGAQTTTAKMLSKLKTTSKCSLTSKWWTGGKDLSGKWSCRPATQEATSSAALMAATTSAQWRTKTWRTISARLAKSHTASNAEAPLATRASATTPGLQSSRKNNRKKRSKTQLPRKTNRSLTGLNLSEPKGAPDASTGYTRMRAATIWPADADINSATFAVENTKIANAPEPLLHAKQKNANAKESLKRPEELLNNRELLKKPPQRLKPKGKPKPLKLPNQEWHKDPHPPGIKLGKRNAKHSLIN